MNEASRRTFLGSAACAAPAALLGGATIGRASDETSRRRALGGSPNPAYSRAVAYGGIVFVAGAIGRKPGTTGTITESFEEQCRHTLDAIKASVEAAGSSLRSVLKCTCFLTDVNDFAAFNKMFAQYFPGDPPARSTVVVKELVVPGAKIEIDCVTCVE
jgi:2-iminobutanoate/2-iminopropanoate deaminase